ncbi:hypothetical protein sscle_01g000970 [Sclerotinia sclerotiorum 1980 UF-70]|uniref:Uncharacterized protein n=2 Tax=Sclerotinia sclerotiorum (strain ATCC 18683 / 1980 / Ss-1) TaxID=665079 RepID=A0A1D9PRK3_SCLS1|nr:hypothetical protein sscle_01g000970 [Sclerotinia sclerotiorum 1980 UF-70]
MNLRDLRRNTAFYIKYYDNVKFQPTRRILKELSPTIDKDVSTFTKFECLHLELQRMVFNEAIPDRKSPVIDFFFEVARNRQKFQLEIKTEIPAATHLMPLLNACDTSRKEIYRRMKHVKTSVPPSNQGLILGKTNEGVPIRYFWKVGSPTGQTYIDPERETLMLNIPDLMRLYRYGGSIDLSKIKRIALTAFGTDIFEDGLPNPKLYEEVLELIRRECPDITVFQMIAMLAANYYYRKPKSEKEPEYHVLDLDSDMWVEDYRDQYDQTIKGEHRENIEYVLDGAKEMEDCYQGYLALLKRSGKGECLKFWEKVKYTAAFHCTFDDDAGWEARRKSVPEPKLYIFALDAWIPANADATPLNKYKGLAQIFEGAPW